MSVRAVKRRPDPNRAENLWVRLLSLSALGVVCMVALLFAASYIMLHKDLPSTVLPVFAYCGCGISALLCGFLCAKSVPRHKALFGLISALPIVLVSLILCLVFHKTVGSGFAINCAVVLGTAALGAIFAVRKRRKRRKYK